nr:uncharacterized protein LOC104644947 [Solanum lycopersicum]
MNPPIFSGSKVGEDPQKFFDGVYKVLSTMGVTFREKEESGSYQFREVSKVWYTQWKDNRSVESGPIEWEEFKEDFLGKYFPHERKEVKVKVQEFINLRQGNMSVEEYSLKFTLLSRYAPSLVSILRDKMRRFVTGVAEIENEECRMTMIHNGMNMSRLMVYAQSIEESKLSMISRNLKRGTSDEQNQARLKKMDLNQYGPSSRKVKVESGHSSQGVKSTCARCGEQAL